MTKDSLEEILGREVQEIHLTVAKSIVMGLGVEIIAETLGVSKEEIHELTNDEEYKEVRLLVGADHAKEKIERDSGWDGIESSALIRLGKRVDRETDTEMLLKIAAVANRATRRAAPPKEAVLDPSQVGHRVPLTLTRRYTEKLNGTGQVVERSQEQRISVLDGSAINPSFKEVNAVLRPQAAPRTQEQVIESKQLVEEESFSMEALKRMVRSQTDE
jgi:hypothetical protein